MTCALTISVYAIKNITCNIRGALNYIISNMVTDRVQKLMQPAHLAMLIDRNSVELGISPQ